MSIGYVLKRCAKDLNIAFWVLALTFITGFMYARVAHAECLGTISLDCAVIRKDDGLYCKNPCEVEKDFKITSPIWIEALENHK